MWLLHVRTRELVHFMDDRSVIGKYAILSHTWEDEEVSFTNIKTSEAHNMMGYRKIDYACRQAEAADLEYVWVDTCCINKDSSAELSESINSMFRWYYNAKICYAGCVLLRPQLAQMWHEAESATASRDRHQD
ncbi:unnamed protein product [Zymoseptoria tritici ST99CH_3D1]|nr:unnamed protein product [Zymoseptoria tritici ST99CH_3D1]